MARIITKELAEKIVKKCGGRRSGKQGAHVLYDVVYEGELVATVSIRHGSSKDQGHDHIPDDMHVRPHFAREMGRCNYSFDDWIQELRNNGTLPELAAEEDEDDDDEQAVEGEDAEEVDG